MSDRPDRLTRRRLWAECFGHCMNPSCEKDIFGTETVLSEFAHIVAAKDGGPPSFDNLLVLCLACHKAVDNPRTAETVPLLREWKETRSQELRTRFSRIYPTFEALEGYVQPLLRRNLNIYRNYGPDAESPDPTARHALWRKFEGPILATNQRLATVLDNNRGLLHAENQDLVDAFIGHTAEFQATRTDEPSVRVMLFPRELNSVFGVETITDDLAPNVSALQNLVAHLISKDQFVELRLLPTPKIVYRDASGSQLELDLRNRPRVHQVYWTGKHYFNKTTNLRLEGLLFVLKWLAARRLHYEFHRPADLTEMVVEHTHEVHFVYEYRASLLNMQEAPLRPGLVVVNLHNWNDGPFSAEAVEYASSMGSRTMNQKEFFLFASGRHP